MQLPQLYKTLSFIVPAAMLSAIPGEASATTLDHAIELVSAEHAIDQEMLHVAAVDTASYPELGYEIIEIVKVASHGEDGGIYRVGFAGPGEPIDIEALEYEALHHAALNHDPLGPVVDLLIATPPDETLCVAVWLREPGGVLPERPDPLEEINEEQLGEWKAMVDDNASAEVEDTLVEGLDLLQSYVPHDAQYVALSEPPSMEETGGVSYAEFAPLLHVCTTPDVIWELANEPLVETIYPPTLEVTPHQNDARIAMGSAYIDDYFGLTGQGVKVAQVEPGLLIPGHNPHLSFSQWHPPGIQQSACYGPWQSTTGRPLHYALSNHAHQMASLIGSTHRFGSSPTLGQDFRGTAPNASLLNAAVCQHANHNQDNIIRASEAAVRWGADVINYSLGATPKTVGPRALTRYVDRVAFKNFKTIVAAAGNVGNAATEFVNEPAIGYGVLSVGAYDSKGNWARSDDSAAVQTAWRDPKSKHGSREKPEVAAPGVGITTLDAYNNPSTAGGTSSSAAMVSGLVAQLIQQNRNLALWPEAVKSLLMVTALNDLDSRAPMDEKSGAGGVEAWFAREVAGQLTDHGYWDGMLYKCSEPERTLLGTIWLEGGKPARVAMSWANYGWHWFDDILMPLVDWDQPTADLDLAIEAVGDRGALTLTVCKPSIFGGSGCRYKYANDRSSNQADENFELISVTPPKSDWYRVYANKARCNFGSEDRYLGWAWYQDT